MPKIFDRVITFHIHGEIYNDDDATPESIINNYIWEQKDIDGQIRLVGRHRDTRGRINSMVRLPEISMCKKSPNKNLVPV